MVRDFNRRDFVKSVGAAGIIGLSGCLSDVPGTAGGPIPMGTILPITGVLEDLGPDMENAANLAIEHVNEAGGPLDREIDMNNTDSETRPEAGVDRYETLVSEQDVVGVVGAASSGVSVPIAERVADDEVMQISPASTSPVLAELGWKDELKYFGRTAPNDGQQGVVMARVLNNYLEADTAGFLFVDNPYGEGLADVARENFDGESVAFQGYDQESTDFTSTLDALFENDPDAIGFVGYPGEGRLILSQWDDGGYGGDWVLSEGLDSEDFFNDVGDLIEGAYLTTPQPEETEGVQRFRDQTDATGPFAPHSYDAAFIAALAIQRAGEASGTAISENFLDVCNPPGEVVTVGEFDKAKDLLSNGDPIQFQGASSPLQMNENYENLNQFAIAQIEGGSKNTVEVIPREEFEGVLD